MQEFPQVLSKLALFLSIFFKIIDIPVFILTLICLILSKPYCPPLSPPIHITAYCYEVDWGGESNVFLLHHLCDLTSISKIFSLNSMNIIFFEKGITFSMMLRNLVTLNSIQFLFLMRYPHSKYLIRPRTNCSYISC